MQIGIAQIIGEATHHPSLVAEDMRIDQRLSSRELYRFAM